MSCETKIPYTGTLSPKITPNSITHCPHRNLFHALFTALGVGAVPLQDLSTFAPLKNSSMISISETRQLSFPFSSTCTLILAPELFLSAVMEIKTVNITQFLDIKNKPFRRTPLDYSHLSYADVLDALAATIIINALAALLIHMTTSLYGMSTHALSVKSLYGGSFLSDCKHLIATRLLKRNNERKLQLTPRITACALLLCLLVAEALLLLSQSSTIETHNLEDLNIRRPQLKPYVGEPFLSSIPQGCISMIQSMYPIWYSPLDLCISYPHAERIIPRKEELDRALSFSVNAQYGKGMLSFIVITADYQYSLDIRILLHSASQAVRMNVTNMINDPEEYLAFLTDSAAQLMGCLNVSDVWLGSDSQESYLMSRFIFNCREVDEESLLIGEGLILSTLSLSNKFISAPDFYSLEPKNGATVLNPITRSRVESYAAREVIRVRGYVLWIVAVALSMANSLLSCLAPDVEIAKSVAISTFLNWETIPLLGSEHVPLITPSSRIVGQNEPVLENLFGKNEGAS